MDLLLELLTELYGADHPLVVLVGQRGADERPWAELTDENIAEFIEALRAVGLDEDASTEVVALAADAFVEISTERTTRDTEAAADEARRQEAIALMQDPPAAEDGDDDEPAEGDAAPATDEPAEGDAPPAADAPEAPAPAADTAPEPQPVAAAATRRPTARRVVARQPDPTQASQRPTIALVAAANGPGFSAGDALDEDQLATAFRRSAEAGRGHHGPDTLIPIARMSVIGRYPEERHLRGDDGMAVNMRKIRALTAREAVVASGGICSPLEVRYDIPTIVTDARPLRDSLPNFGATRGGITFIPPTQFEDFSGASEIWLESTDAAPGGATKDRLTVVCPSTDEANVDAITLRLKFGNFQGRFHPEGIQEAITNATAYHSRRAEVKLWDDICSGSLAITVGEGLGALPDFLSQLDRLSAVYRSSNRVPDSTMLEVRIPSWVLPLLRADGARRPPGDATLALADAQIVALAASHGVNLITVLEGGTGQQYNRQGAGALQGWKGTFEALVFQPGTWIFLDGGTLDLGEVRDSTLVGTNDYEMFSETFEGAAKVGGPDSWCVTFNVCPDGSTGSPNASYDPCTSGS